MQPDDQPLDNDPSEWQSSIDDWLRDGQKIYQQLIEEANAHVRKAESLKAQAKNVRRLLPRAVAEKAKRAATGGANWCDECQAGRNSKAHRAHREREGKDAGST